MLSNARYIMEFIVVKILAFFLNIIPHSIALLCGDLIGRLIWFLGIRKSVSRRNFDLCVGQNPERDKIIMRSYINFVKNLIELIRIEKIVQKINDLVKIEKLELLLECAKKGEGLILCTGHLGNFELFGAALARANIPIDSIAMPMKNPYIEKHLAKIRARSGMKIVSINDAPQYILQNVRKGRHIALLYDQDAGSSGVIVPFCDVPASTPDGPAILAKRTGVKIAVGFIHRDKSGITHSAEIVDIIEPTTAEKTMTLLNRYLSEAVRQYPDQYFWAHRRFKSTAGYK